jgi:uncharacterized protein (TIGR04551 family)
MARLLALGALLLSAAAAQAQQDPAPAKPAKAPAKAAAPAKKKSAAEAKKDAAKAEAAKAAEAKAEAPAPAPIAATPASTPAAASAVPAPMAPPAPAIDPEEFRRQVMEEVRKELKEAREKSKEETEWVKQDSTARVRDSEAVEALKTRVNLFQPHGYLRWRFEFFNNMDLKRGEDPAGYNLFPRPFINSGDNHSQSDANMRLRFEPTLAVSEDLHIHAQIDVLDNILMGSNPTMDPILDTYTPLAVLSTNRAATAVHVKRVWGRANTPLGELSFGRMGYHWGLGILHNDGNGIDSDYGDTYDRVAFAPRDFRGHKFTIMMDLLDKGATTTGEHGELGRSVDLDTLDDGYRIGLQVEKLDSPEEARRKLDAGEWVINYGAVVDYRVQGWDTPRPTQNGLDGIGGITIGDQAANRNGVMQRKAKLYMPDVYFSFRKGKVRVDGEIGSKLGSVGTRATLTNDLLNPDLSQQITFFQWGGALQADLSMLPADALLLGFEFGAASGDSGAYGFGARPWRSGTGGKMGTNPDGSNFYATGPGDIDGPHYNFSVNNNRGRINNFVFNRAFNVDTILFRNLITSVTSAWYAKPSLRYRPTGRKSGGGDDTGFELTAALVYSQAWYPENTPGNARPLGLEANIGISHDTPDRFHLGLQYGLLLPFQGLGNTGLGYATSRTPTDASIAHAIRAMMAIPF